MITVPEVTKIILSSAEDFGTERIALAQATGRVLAEDLTGDRDFPPFDRVMYDGIAIRYEDYEKGRRQFPIAGMQAAGAPMTRFEAEGQCIEIMTGAILPQGFDTIVQYEWIDIEAGVATIQPDKTISRGRHIHPKGSDRKEGDLIAAAPRIITAAEINIAATIGKARLLVKKLPRAVVISTGDELVDIPDTPLPHQIRRSNVHSVAALLKEYGIHATLLHIDDKVEEIDTVLAQCLDDYDVIILSGGVSKGKFDFIPDALARLGVEKAFHRVAQRPGKPFWFGKKGRTTVFALPGNPVSTFVSTLRYVIPWLRKCLGLSPMSEEYAVLKEDFSFAPPLQYFLSVKTGYTPDGRLIAMPRKGNGSGDLANLADIDGFLELPQELDFFPKGSAYRLWRFR